MFRFEVPVNVGGEGGIIPGSWFSLISLIQKPSRKSIYLLLFDQMTINLHVCVHHADQKTLVLDQQ